MVIHSTFPDFVLFLYVHIAHSDDAYDPTEIATIKDKMKNLFPEGTDLEKKLYQAIRDYNAFDHARISDLIRDTFAHFADNANISSTKLFNDVKAIMEADGQVLPTEREAFEAITRIIKMA